ncbi:ABC transporter ATP-binding protein [Dactylosporangium maewongense]|uniref:ABC transporter ATP-binding protein n=1 Tax=Dactylosporangium maewongense TaxID=634393 RepID=A0ABN2DHH2_9ACTN
MLTVRNIRVAYGGTVLGLRDVSLDVPAGAIVAVLGSNGAGKTTLLRAISGVLGEHRGRVEHGEITFDGESLLSRSPAEIVAAGVVQAPEGRRIFSGLTVTENLRIGAFGKRDRSATAHARRLVYELFPILHDRGDQRAALLSGGQQQMLAIGRALMASPRLLLLDEPSLGLAPALIAQIGHIIADINERGTTVMLVEQNAAMALGVASQALVLTTGEVSLSGPAAALAANEDVRDLYLGGDIQAAVGLELAESGPRPRLTRWTR